MLAYHEIEEMTKRGVPGVWTHGFYDGWAPNYMFYVANGHNSIGRFYETFGNGGADTRDRTVAAAVAARLVPAEPAAARASSGRCATTSTCSSRPSCFAMNFVAQQQGALPQQLLPEEQTLGRQGDERRAGGVRHPGRHPRPVEAADMVNLLRLQGVEVHQRRRSEFDASRTRSTRAGSYVVRMDQPYSRMADMLLDTQYYNVNDPRPYDDTGWTLGAMRNVKTVRVTDKSVLQRADDAADRGRHACAGSVDGLGRPLTSSITTPTTRSPRSASG